MEAASANLFLAFPQQLMTVSGEVNPEEYDQGARGLNQSYLIPEEDAGCEHSKNWRQVAINSGAGITDSLH